MTDTERLDWLDQSGYLLGRNFDGSVEIVAYGIKNVIGRGENPLASKTIGKALTLRAAIDQAMAQQEEAEE